MTDADTAIGEAHPIGHQDRGHVRTPPATMTPATRALLAALASAVSDACEACAIMLRSGRCDISVLTEITGRDTCAALETLRYRHSIPRKGVALVKACVLVQRWVDRLAAAPGDPDMDAYCALYAVLLRRVVIDGVTIAAETMAACRRAAEAALNPPLDAALNATDRPLPCRQTREKSDAAATTTKHRSGRGDEGAPGPDQHAGEAG